MNKSKSSEPAVQVSQKLYGIIFVFVSDISGNLNEDLAVIVKMGMKRRANTIGMLSGLLQLSVDNESESALEMNCKELVGEIMSFIHDRGVAVWTIKQCSVGCWGNEDWANYGVMVPNLMQLMGHLSSAKPGQNIRIH